MNEKPIYIHYGSDKFEPWRFREVKNPDWGNKPRIGGLWASRVNTDYGWKDWCESENFHTDRLKKSFRFTLADTAKILEISSTNAVKVLPRLKTKLPTIEDWICPDFEQIMKNGYDAIELFLSNDFELYWSMYGWDCDSILIMNKKIIVPEGSEDNG